MMTVTSPTLFEKANGEVDGITISGGEPFEQEEELLELICHLLNKTEDILIFSGKTIRRQSLVLFLRFHKR